MEIAGREENPLLELFAKGEYVENNFVYAGVFFNHEDKYLNNLAKVLHSLIHKDKDRFEKFENFIRNVGYEVDGKAVYPRGDVIRWIRPFKLFRTKAYTKFPRKSQKDRMLISELKVSPPSDIDNSAGLVFVRLKGYEDKPLSEETKWELRKEILDIWSSLTENQQVKAYLQEVKEMMELFEKSLPGAYYRYPFSRLVFYLMPVNFDRFVNAVIVSNVSLYTRRTETRQNLWNEILKDMKEDYRKDLEYALQKRGQSLEYIRTLLDRSLSQSTLDLLRKDWKEVLKKLVKGQSERVLAAFVGRPEKEEVWFSFGDIQIPGVDVELMCFVENDFVIEEKGEEYSLSELLKRFESMFTGNSKIKGYLGNINLRFELKEDGKPYKLDLLFDKPGFTERFLKQNGVKPQKDNSYLSKDSLDILYGLTYFCARLTNFAYKNMKSDKITALLLVLDTELAEDEGKYPLWNEVSALYDLYGLPVQTVTKKFFRSLLGDNPNAVIKNMMISLFKDAKILEFEFGGFSLPQALTVYAVLEKPSPKFFYRREVMDETGERHYVYEVYRIQINGNRATVSLEDKFILLAGGYGSDAARFESWVQNQMKINNVRLCFITTVKDSYLAHFQERLGPPSEIEGKLLSIKYDELKTAYLSDRAQHNCYVIYTQEMNRLMEKLGIQADRDMAAIAIKPAQVSKEFEENMYHSALQVFFTERVGWSKEEIYAERKSLFIFTLIALSMYESESFSTPYAKLSVWSRERTRYLRLEREMKEYLVPIRALLYEMLYAVAPLPGAEKEAND